MNNQTPRGLSPHQNGGALTSPSPRSGSISLQAAATLNAGLQRSDPDTRECLSSSSYVWHCNIMMLTLWTESPQNSPSARRHSMSQSPTANRRLSQVLHNLNVADPSLPPPGEMVSSAQPSFTRPGNASPRFSTSPLMLALGGPPESPYAHNRAPSLGELHQELENEQEFQVNRLLHEIRRLQIQVQSQQQGQGQSAVATDEASDSSASGSASQTVIPEPVVGSVPRSPGLSFHPRASFDAARAAEIRRRSRTPSHGASPRFRAASVSGDSGEQWILGGRDESAFYQAETQMLTRENQMLRHRIRDLGKSLFTH